MHQLQCTSRRALVAIVLHLQIALFLSAATGIADADRASDRHDPRHEPSADPMMPFVEHVANWTAHLSLPSNHVQMPPNASLAGGTDHIFVNGNLARVLLSTWRLQNPKGHLEEKHLEEKNPHYRTQGLAWCDTLVELQAKIGSARGNDAGYWGVGYGGAANCSKTAPLRGYCAHSGDIYFGDTGTAVTALALCRKLSTDAAQRARFMESMELYATFVLEGSHTAPVHKKGAADSFVDSETGAVGCGYYACTNRTSDDCAKLPSPRPGAASLNCPSRSPYVIATGTTGAAFFAELYAVTKNETHKNVAIKALEYASSLVLRTGEIPCEPLLLFLVLLLVLVLTLRSADVLDGANCSKAECRSVATGQLLTPRPLGPGWPYDTISYVTEGVLAVAINIPEQKATLIKQWKPTVDFLLREQNADGWWGEGLPSDVMRSPRVLSLLSWWLTAVETPKYKDKPVELAVARYLDFLRIEGIGKTYGVCDNTITTGMAALAVADAMQFGVSY